MKTMNQAFVHIPSHVPTKSLEYDFLVGGGSSIYTAVEDFNKCIQLLSLYPSKSAWSEQKSNMTTCRCHFLMERGYSPQAGLNNKTTFLKLSFIGCSGGFVSPSSFFKQTVRCVFRPGFDLRFA